MTDLIVILIIIPLILLLLVLLVRREPHEVLRTLAERITRVKITRVKGSKWFDVRFAGPAHRSEINVVSVAITQQASPEPIKAKKKPA